MKKLMFALATAAALVGMADIESANTVGYVNRTGVAAGVWQILPCQFETTQTTDIDIQSYVQGTFNKTVSFYDEGWDQDAPQIQVRDPKTGMTSYYYYLADAYDEGAEVEELPGWADQYGNYVKSLTFAAGSGFWFWSKEACDVTFAGQVVGEATSALTVYPIWTLIGNAFPMGFSLNGISWAGIEATHSFYDEDWDSTAPQIQVRDANTGKTSYYYYLKDAYVESTEEELAGWADMYGNYVPVTEVIPEGVGFWFRPTVQIDVEFAK